MFNAETGQKLLKHMNGHWFTYPILTVSIYFKSHHNADLFMLFINSQMRLSTIWCPFETACQLVFQSRGFLAWTSSKIYSTMSSPFLCTTIFTSSSTTTVEESHCGGWKLRLSNFICTTLIFMKDSQVDATPFPLNYLFLTEPSVA